MNVLIVFPHGLGDVVQFTAVLAHLKHYHPDWEIDVVTDWSKSSTLVGHCRRSLDATPDENAYDQVFRLDWWECDTCFSRHPSTKVERCLTDVFKVEPIAELLEYSLPIPDATLERAAEYLDSIGADSRAIVIHYEGNTATDRKNLAHGHVEALCARILQAGYVPVILDWDNRSPLPDQKRIFCPRADHRLWGGAGTGNAPTIAALITHARACVAIDSGPQKVALTTSTPTVCVWRKHHPLNYVAPTHWALHLVPDDVGRNLRGPGQVQTPPYFEAAYQVMRYPYRNVDQERQVELRHWLWNALQDRLTFIGDPALKSWQQLTGKLLKEDLENPSWAAAEEREAYIARYKLAATFRPQSICEIGVRAGYSAAAFLSATPARYVGIDNNSATHGGIVGAIEHAEKLLNRTITRADSQQMTELPGEYDMVHVDGDHTYEGCAHDLKLALTANPRQIVVDDFLNILPVHAACWDFRRDHPEWTMDMIDDGYKGICVFRRAA